MLHSQAVHTLEEVSLFHCFAKVVERKTHPDRSHILTSMAELVLKQGEREIEVSYVLCDKTSHWKKSHILRLVGVCLLGVGSCGRHGTTVGPACHAQRVSEKA